jgi:AcrR family transcriptional regulator
VTVENREGYTKGILRRKQIYDVTLQLIDTYGADNVSLGKIASEVGLTSAGILHYYKSMDDLLVNVMQEYDRQDMDPISGSARNPDKKLAELVRDPVVLLDTTIASLRRKTSTPGAVALYTYLLAKSADGNFPKRSYIMLRKQFRHQIIKVMIESMDSSGKLSSKISPDAFATAFEALLDGVQIQWLNDRSLDIESIIRNAFQLIPFLPQESR